MDERCRFCGLLALTMRILWEVISHNEDIQERMGFVDDENSRVMLGARVLAITPVAIQWLPMVADSTSPHSFTRNSFHILHHILCALHIPQTNACGVSCPLLFTYSPRQITRLELLTKHLSLKVTNIQQWWWYNLVPQGHTTQFPRVHSHLYILHGFPFKSNKAICVEILNYNINNLLL